MNVTLLEHFSNVTIREMILHTSDLASQLVVYTNFIKITAPSMHLDELP
jgi:hypothetical protein